MVAELIEEGEFDAMVPEKFKPLPEPQQVEKTVSEHKLVLVIDDKLPPSEVAKEMSAKLQEYKPFIMSVKEPEKLKTSVPYLYVDGVPACGPEGLD